MFEDAETTNSLSHNLFVSVDDKLLLHNVMPSKRWKKNLISKWLNLFRVFLDRLAAERN